MILRPLGTTGLTVSALAFGAGSVGSPDTPDERVARLVDVALDLGVTLFDTARSYGLSEERLGRLLRGRRDGVVLSTKLGYGVDGVADWTGPCVTAGVDGALRRLRTDRIDVVHLHSCGLDTLRHGDVVRALEGAVAAGKVRVAAYSGEGDALRWAVESGSFGSVQCSVSVVDQGALDGPVAAARARGLGVLAKRPLGNAPWRFEGRPDAGDVAEAWGRFHAMGLDPRDPGWAETFARFAAFAPGVDAMLLGTADERHLRAAADAVAKGPLDDDAARSLRAAYARVGEAWGGRV